MKTLVRTLVFVPSIIFAVLSFKLYLYDDLLLMAQSIMLGTLSVVALLTAAVFSFGAFNLLPSRKHVVKFSETISTPLAVVLGIVKTALLCLLIINPWLLISTINPVDEEHKKIAQALYDDNELRQAKHMWGEDHVRKEELSFLSGVNPKGLVSDVQGKILDAGKAASYMFNMYMTILTSPASEEAPDAQLYPEEHSAFEENFKADTINAFKDKGFEMELSKYSTIRAFMWQWAIAGNHDDALIDATKRMVGDLLALYVTVYIVAVFSFYILFLVVLMGIPSLALFRFLGWLTVKTNPKDIAWVL